MQENNQEITPEIKKDNSNLAWGLVVIMLGIMFIGGIAWTYFKSLESNTITVSTPPTVSPTAVPLTTGTAEPATIPIEEQLSTDSSAPTKEVGADITKEIDQINNTNMDTNFGETQLNDLSQ